MNFSALFACYAGRDIAKSSHTLIDAEEERHHPKHEADAEGPLRTNSERCNRARAPQIASCEPYCKSYLMVTVSTLTASTPLQFLWRMPCSWPRCWSRCSSTTTCTGLFNSEAGATGLGFWGRLCTHYLQLAGQESVTQLFDAGTHQPKPEAHLNEAASKRNPRTYTPRPIPTSPKKQT